MATDPQRPRTRAQMRELDRRATDEFGIPSLILMENAGRGAAEVAASLVTPADGAIIVFCGRGNNGGDGFVVARHLFNRGFRILCYFVGEVSEIAPGTDAYVNFNCCRRMGIEVLEHTSLADRETMARAIGWTALLIDALLGTGLQGEVRGPYATLISLLNARRAPILSLDVPSGLDCDTGEVLGKAVRATRTVTFGAPKVGFTRGRGPETTGEVIVVDISLPRQLLV